MLIILLYAYIQILRYIIEKNHVLEGVAMSHMSRYAGYNADSLRRDLISGLIVGIIAIPLGMAFAIASGVKPQYGLYTTIAAGFLISLFGGSRFQIGGPTGAFIPILLAIVLQYGIENLQIAGMMAGIMLVLMGVFRLGGLIKFIPRPVILGFTAGIAVIIFTGQLENFLGLEDVEKFPFFHENMAELFGRLGTINLYSIATALICFAVMWLTNKYVRIVPGSLAGLVVSSIVAVLLFSGKVATVGSTFGAIPSSLPDFHFPEITLDRIVMLLQPALVIALLGGVESLLSAVVADSMTGDRHHSNRELIGQGIANVVTPMFSGIPATGAIARTAANIKSGAASPVSGMVHSAVVLLVLLVFAPLASSIPLASMAPILMAVAWNMSERRHFMRMLRTRTPDSAVLLLTFTLTVLTNITIAVQAGIGLAIIVFVGRMGKMFVASHAHSQHRATHDNPASHPAPEVNVCPHLLHYTLTGPLFFGVTDALEHVTKDLNRYKPKVLLLSMDQVPYLDLTGEAQLAAVVRAAREHGTEVFISGIAMQPVQVLRSTGLAALIGPEHFFPNTEAAIKSAIRRIGDQRCANVNNAANDACRCALLAAGKEEPCTANDERTQAEDRTAEEVTA